MKLSLPRLELCTFVCWLWGMCVSGAVFFFWWCLIFVGARFGFGVCVWFLYKCWIKRYQISFLDGSSITRNNLEAMSEKQNLLAIRNYSKISNSIWLHMKRVTRQIYLYLCVENLSILGNLLWCFLVLVDRLMIISLPFCRSKLIDWWLFPAAEAGSGAGPAADGAWTDRFLLNVLIVGYNGFWIFCLSCNLWFIIWQIWYMKICHFFLADVSAVDLSIIWQILGW